MSGSEQDRTDTVIDSTVLQEIRDLMEDDFPDLVRRFLTDSADLIDRIEEGIFQGDAVSVHRAAHTLKSSAAALGALDLSNRAKHLEALGRSGVLAGAQAQAAAAHAQFALVKETLEKSIEEGSQPWTPT